MNQPKPVPHNPFRPGNGQKPIYLAGRSKEQDTFTQMVRETLPQNSIITGLRGVGKTVLLDELKPIAQTNGWLWTGNDLSESSSLTEDRIARRIVLDVSTLLAPLVVQQDSKNSVGFLEAGSTKRPITFDDLWKIYETAPGLTDDKLKAVLANVQKILELTSLKGIIFAYDEAQNLSDHAMAKEFPLSILLDVFSYFQRQSTRIQFRLVLTGLPTLFPKLNEARTYTERMFHVMHLQRLENQDAREAVVKPIQITKSRLTFAPATMSITSCGYLTDIRISFNFCARKCSMLGSVESRPEKRPWFLPTTSLPSWIKIFSRRGGRGRRIGNRIS